MNRTSKIKEPSPVEAILEMLQVAEDEADSSMGLVMIEPEDFKVLMDVARNAVDGWKQAKSDLWDTLYYLERNGRDNMGEEDYNTVAGAILDALDELGMDEPSAGK